MKGIILCTRYDADGNLLALIHIGGISILERQARILRQNDVDELLVITDSYSEPIKKVSHRLNSLGLKVTLHSVSQDEDLPKSFIGQNDEGFFLCDGASIYDYQLPQGVSSNAKAGIPLIRKTSVAPGIGDEALQVTQSEESYYFYGLAYLPAGYYEDMNPGLGNKWLGQYLSAILSEHPEALVDVSKLSQYDYDMRRENSCLWFPIKSSADNSVAKRKLLDRAQKSVLDWPAWYIHRPIEKAITFYLCEFPVTPNQITLINIAIAFAGIAAFAYGHMLLGLILALVAGIVDGLDGKQARVKVMMTKIGKFEELSDRIYEYGWYGAIAYWLVNSGAFGTVPYTLFTILFILHGIEVLNGYIFKLKRHVQLDDFGPLERRFRLIGSRRNTNMWLLVPFVLFDAVYAGLWTITVYYALTVAFKGWRTAVHLKQPDTKRVA